MQKPRFIQQLKQVVIFILLLCFVASCTSDTDKTLEKAQLALDEGQYERALALADSMLKSVPDNFEARRIQVLSSVAQADILRALDLQALVETSHPKQAEELLKALALGMVKLALKDENYFLRSAGIKAIAEMGDPRLIPLLIPGLRDSAMFVRFFAVESLGYLGGPEALKLIMAAGSSDREGMVRGAAVKVLNDMAETKPEGLDLGNLLATFSADPDPSVRLFALAAMAKLGDEQAFAKLIGDIASLKKDERIAGAVALGRSGQAASETLLIEYLRGSDALLRMYAAESMGKLALPAFYEPLKKVLHDNDPAVRGAAATSLGELGNRAIIPQLEGLREDANAIVRLSAAEGLKYLGIERPTIYEAGLKDPDYGVRHFAIGSLRRVWGKKALPFLVSAMKDEAQRVRLTAIRAIGALGEIESLPILKKALKDPDQAVRTYAAGNVIRLLNKAAGMEMKDVRGE